MTLYKTTNRAKFSSLDSEIQPNCAKIAGKLFYQLKPGSAIVLTVNSMMTLAWISIYVQKMNELKDNQLRKANSGKLRV